MTRTVLVGAHLGHAEGDAVGLAVELARPFGARIVLGGIVVLTGGDVEDAHTQLTEELEALRATVPADVPSQIEIAEASSIVRGLHDLATACDAELLVLGSHHRTGLLRALRGDLATDVVFTAPCAVVIAQPSETTGMPQRVGIAWDDSPDASEALEWAVQLVERTAGELHILRVLEPRHAEGTKPGIDEQAQLHAAEQAARPRVPTHARGLWGDPAEELITASRQLDLLVMGSRGHSPVHRALFGSVSTRVMHEARCPVVVMPAGVHSKPDTAVV